MVNKTKFTWIFKRVVLVVEKRRNGVIVLMGLRFGGRKY
jgi:hypothetical protein